MVSGTFMDNMCTEDGGGGADGADLQRISPLSGSEVVTVGSRLLSSLYIIYIYIYIDEGQKNQTAGVSNV